MADKPMRFDLGCGTKLKEGFVGIDFVKHEGVELVMNLDEPNIQLPFQDDTVEAFYASHFFEHIVNLMPLLNECWRCLKYDGQLEIIVPLAPSRSAFDDPTHVRFFTEATFKYFTDDAPGNQIIPSIKGHWNIIKMDWTPMYAEDIQNVFENKMREIHVIMQPIKPEPAIPIEKDAKRLDKEEIERQNITKGIFHTSSGGSYAKSDN